MAAPQAQAPQALALIPQAQRPQVIHQSGAKQIDALRANYEAAGVQAELTPFIDDTASAFAQADLVICRAGASTVTELAAVGVAALNQAMLEMLPREYAGRVATPDEVMATRLRALRDELGRGEDATMVGYPIVVAIVGAQHVPGIVDRLRSR